MYRYNPKWVLFEGPDRSGKSTTSGLVYRVRGSIDNMQDRGLLTSAFYSPPEQGVEYHIDMLRAWLNLPTSRLVIMFIDYQTQYKRALATQHAIVPTEQFQKEIEYYTHWGNTLLKEYPDKVFLADANKDQAAVAQDIVNFLAADEAEVDVVDLDNIE